MLPNLSLVLSLALALSLPAAAAPAGPQAPLAASTSSYCNLTYTVTYHDAFGPIFVENHYACDLPPLSSSSSSSRDPIHVSAPYYSSYSRTQKHTIHHYGCAPLPDARHLSRNKYSNLFWGISQLTNMSCLDPGEAVEYVDVNRDWTADWRFTNVNRGTGRVCDWYGEIANVARALHYFCFHALGRPMEDEFSGGEEVLAYGRSEGEGVRVGGVEGRVEGGGGQWWCVRYSKKGWGLEVFDKWCLGV